MHRIGTCENVNIESCVNMESRVDYGGGYITYSSTMSKHWWPGLISYLVNVLFIRTYSTRHKNVPVLEL